MPIFPPSSARPAIVWPIVPTPTMPTFTGARPLACAQAKLQHAVDGATSLARDLFGHADLRRQRLQRTQHSVERYRLHECAHSVGIHRIEKPVGMLFTQAVQNAHLRSHREFLSLGFADVAKHSLGGKKKVRSAGRLPSMALAMHELTQPHSGWISSSISGCSSSNSVTSSGRMVLCTWQ